MTARRTALRLALAAFAIYNANLRSLTSEDTFATRYLPISLLREGNLDLDEFKFLYADAAGRGAVPYFLHRAGAHYISNYPVMPALLATPVYVLPVALGWPHARTLANGLSETEVVGTALAKLAASFAVALSVGLVYLTLYRLADPRCALVGALVYGFATSTWSVSSQGLWQHAMSQPLLALAFFLLLRRRPAFAAAGAALALSVACRPTNLLLALVVSAWVAHHHRRFVPRYAALPAFLGALLVAYNLHYFGTVQAGYARLGFPLPESAAEAAHWFAGLLVSPSRGLLTHSPVLVFPLAGLLAALFRPTLPLLRYLAAGVLATLCLFSFYGMWHGGFGFSYRILVDLLPALILFLPAVWTWIAARRGRAALFAASAALSLLVQVVGAFFYPCGWFHHPVNAGAHPERFWDWSDPQVLRCLRNGPAVPEVLALWRAPRARAPSSRFQIPSRVGAPRSGDD